jgi:hypothetical protein
MDQTLLQLACSPSYTVDQTLLAVTARQNERSHFQVQVWESPDGGSQWANLAAFETEIPAVALAWPDDPVERSIFLATRNRVIRIFWHSENGELAMTQSFLDDDLNVTAIAATPTFAQDRQLYVATNHGVYLSQDAGVTWALFGEMLAERAIVALFPVSPTTPLLAVELGGMVWRLDAVDQRTDLRDQRQPA